MAKQQNTAPAQFTAHIVAGDKWFVAVNDAPVKLTARVTPDDGRFLAAVDGLGLEDVDGNPFTAIVDGLQLEGSGSTPSAAQDALVQAMRSWLERQDTAGKLAESLGIEYLDEAAEVVLQFVDTAEADARHTHGVARRPPAEVQQVEWDDAASVSIRTFRG